jgi:hypothetical protein
MACPQPQVAVAHLRLSTRNLGLDYWPYGLEANRAVLKELADCLDEQDLIPKRIKLSELFAPDSWA